MRPTLDDPFHATAPARRRRRATRALLALTAAGGLAVLATGCSPTVAVSPSTVAPGGAVVVSGTCDPSSSGWAMSDAFIHDASHDFAGVPAQAFTTDANGNYAVAATIDVNATPGQHTISARCGGGLLPDTPTFTVT